jgi:hypothetical protein
MADAGFSLPKDKLPGRLAQPFPTDPATTRQ